MLAQPTRRRLLILLGELGGSASTDALAVQLGMHPNGVRTHLQRLRDAGLVTHRRVPRPRGRPRDEWAISPEARPGGEPPHAYEALAGWLARAVPATPARMREVEAAGREIGKQLATAPHAVPRRAIEDLLAALGFQPQVVPQPAGRLTCRLGNCPYRSAARENRDIVCTLHRGMTRGLLDRVAPGASLVRFMPHDPDAAGCEIEISGLPS